MKRFISAVFFLGMLLCSLSAQEYPEGAPSFSSTTKDAVLFRYKFQPGQKVSMDMSMNTEMKTESEEGEMSMPFVMTFEANYAVKSVDKDGNARAELVITRMTMKSSGFLDISYDSADPKDAAKDKFTSINALINVPIPVQISPLGKLLSVDTNPLLKAAQKMGQQLDPDQFNQQIEQLTKNSFVQLSADPLKAGDVYDAGTISTSFGSMSTMEADVKYEVVAVSADKKQAILKPVVTFSIPGVTLTQSDFNGWILFDLQKGNVKQSFAKQVLEFEVIQSKKASYFLIDMGVTFKTDI